MNDLLDDRILDRVGRFFKKFKARNILKTTEEVEANTNEENLVSAVVVSGLIDNLGGCRFYEDEAGNKYVVGADSVPKKLGNGGKISFTMNFSTAATSLSMSATCWASGTFTVVLNVDTLSVISVTKNGGNITITEDGRTATGDVSGSVSNIRKVE